MKKLLLILFLLPVFSFCQEWVGDERNIHKIIGWTEEGYVSYLMIESFEENYGQSEGDFDIVYYLSFNIINIKADKLVSSVKLENSPGIAPKDCWGGDIGKNCFNFIYMKYKDLIIDLHNKYNITNSFQNIYFYDYTSWKMNGKKYSLVLDTVSVNNKCYNYDFGNRDRIYKLYTYNSLRQRKLISSGEIKCTGDIYLNGFYISPFEDRILISISSRASQADYEPIEKSFHKFIGCSLNPSTFK